MQEVGTYFIRYILQLSVNFVSFYSLVRTSTFSWVIVTFCTPYYHCIHLFCAHVSHPYSLSTYFLYFFFPSSVPAFIPSFISSFLPSFFCFVPSFIPSVVSLLPFLASLLPRIHCFPPSFFLTFLHSFLCFFPSYSASLASFLSSLLPSFLPSFLPYFSTSPLSCPKPLSFFYPLNVVSYSATRPYSMHCRSCCFLLWGAGEWDSMDDDINRSVFQNCFRWVMS